jgi:hypothetical protein
LRRRAREQPDLLDLPLPVRRLQFARWLVEQGRMGETLDSGQEEQPWEEWGATLPSGMTERSGKRSSGPHDAAHDPRRGVAPTPNRAPRTPRRTWRRTLLSSLSGRWRGNETAAGIVDTPHG